MVPLHPSSAVHRAISTSCLQGEVSVNSSDLLSGVIFSCKLHKVHDSVQSNASTLTRTCILYSEEDNLDMGDGSIWIQTLRILLTRSFQQSKLGENT